MAVDAGDGIIDDCASVQHVLFNVNSSDNDLTHRPILEGTKGISVRHFPKGKAKINVKILIVGKIAVDF